jgi:four helix bundle protein
VAARLTSIYEADEMQAFRDLKVWEKAHRLALDVYRATAAFPREEIYSLTSQIRRAATSVPANIAEGCGRNGPNELRHFFEMAMGSASELEYHLLLTRDLGFLKDDSYILLHDSVCEVKRMLAAFLQKVRSATPASKKCP